MKGRMVESADLGPVLEREACSYATRKSCAAREAGAPRRADRNHALTDIGRNSDTYCVLLLAATCFLERTSSALRIFA